MDWIMSLVQEFSAFAKANPWVGLPITAWLLGMATLVFRKTPGAIAGFIKAQCTTTLIFDTSYTVGHQGTFDQMMTWFGENRYANLSRIVRIYFRWMGEDGVKPWVRMPVAGMSETSQLVLWEGMPCMISCQREGGDKALISENTPYVVTIVRLGRDRNSLIRMVEEFRERSVQERPVRRKLVGTEWMLQGSIRHRPLDTVVTNDNLVDRIVADIRSFEESEQWYVEHGIPYKLCFCLHGPPGTGKNSIIRAVAFALGRGIDSVSLNTTTDLFLSSALTANTGSKAFILFDDFDDAKFHARNESLRTQIAEPEPLPRAIADAPARSQGESLITMEAQPPEERKPIGVSRQGLLSILDGEDTPHGRVFFMTTNDMSNLDSAITRAGRIDYHFYVGLLNHDSIRRYLLRQYGQEFAKKIEGIRFAEIAGSVLESYYKQHARNPDGIVAVIPKEPQRLAAA